MARTTRGPLPAGVYWRRRLFVLALLALVGLATLPLVSGGDESAPERATVAAAEPSDPPQTADPQRQLRRDRPERRTIVVAPPAGPAEVSLADPVGDCRDSDVLVVPRIEEAVAGRDVVVTLVLRTLTSPACTWALGRRSLALAVTDGDIDLWTSAHCPRQVPDDEVVLRSEVNTIYDLVWTPRRSFAGCPSPEPWVQPGEYDVQAAAIGGELSGEVPFELGDPAEVLAQPDPGPATADLDPPARVDRPGDARPNRDRDGAREPDRPRDGARDGTRDGRDRDAQRDPRPGRDRRRQT